MCVCVYTFISVLKWVTCIMRFLSSMCNLQQKQIAWNWTNNECFPFKFMVTSIMTQLHKACSTTHDIIGNKLFFCHLLWIVKIIIFYNFRHHTKSWSLYSAWGVSFRPNVSFTCPKCHPFFGPPLVNHIYVEFLLFP